MTDDLNRRAFLKLGAAAPVPAAAAPARELRLGLIGAGARGTSMLEISLRHPGVRVTAVCDVREDRAARARQMVADAQRHRPEVYCGGPEDYRRMLDRPDLDAVLIMTPQDQHAPQAIAAMKAGKHVGSETPSAYTVEECWELVETKEKTGRRYMLLENYPYARPRMMVLHMARKGAFGDLTYGETSYIHDTRSLAFERDGSLAWRGRIARDHRGDLYPTHGLGPMSLWMGIHRGDRLVSMVSMDTAGLSLQDYAARRLGTAHPAARPGFFRKRDVTLTLIRTARERLIALRYDTCTPRPAGGWEQLQGTRGAYDGSPGGAFVYLDGRSPGHQWQPLEAYREEFEHPFWRREAAEAARTGHGGGDYFVLREFYSALEERREPAIDVYDGAAWSSILPLSGQSIRDGNRAVPIPDFTHGRWNQPRPDGFGLTVSH